MWTIGRTRWLVPLFSVLLGAACFAAFAVGDDLWMAVFSLALLSLLGLGLLAGGRSDMVRGLRGDGRDEYWRAIDEGATLIAGVVLVTAVIGMCLWEWAHGRDGTPYAQLGALSGVAYVVALAVLRLRR